MKKMIALLFCIILYSQHLIAQDTVHLKNSFAKTIVTDRAPQGAFAELFGRSLIFSINYDRRFFKRVDGLGFTVGMGYVSIDDGFGDNLNLFSIPVTVNYLLGNNGKYFEVGAGATYFNANVTNTGDATSGGSSVVGTMTIGYRNQPINSGFMFRAGLNPIFFKDAFIPYYPYVSFGYSF